MKKNIFLRVAIMLCPVISFMTSGCVEKKQTAGKPVVASIQADTTVSLKPDIDQSPTCQIHLDFMYLKPYSESDSISQKINATLQRAFFKSNLAGLSPEIFIDSVRQRYVSGYKNDLLKYYEADLHNKVSAEDIPQWYNYEYEITSELNAGRDSIWNYTVTTFQNTGGAHPNTWGKWTNIDPTTGSELTKKEVFAPGADATICNLILKQLINEANTRLETDTISCIEGLQAAGILLDTDLYIPDNFLLQEDGVTFLYNRYEIAPYSMGDFQLTVPYTEIETFLQNTPHR